MRADQSWQLNSSDGITAGSNLIADSVMLLGYESSGKSAVFRGLVGRVTGDESNFRGSTVICHHGCLPEEGIDEVYDAPGIRTLSDSQTNRIALERLGLSDRVLMVVRATNAEAELDGLLSELGPKLWGKRVAVVITFRDKAPLGIDAFAAAARRSLNVPVVVLNAKKMSPAERVELIGAIRLSASLGEGARIVVSSGEHPSVVRPPATWLENPVAGPALAILAVVAMFAAPVWIAYQIAAALQGPIDQAVISPLKTLSGSWPEIIRALLTGGYGVITLGWYSFLWAFPVVALIGLSVALAEETGLKERVTSALDPWMRRIGLHGRDLIPVLSGFGCNVVAVFQSRSCSACTRKSCVSMITFGSACSYQIGAALSLFSAAGSPWLFAPYLGTLFLVAALHTRLWYGALSGTDSISVADRSFLQTPSWRAVSWRFRSVLLQFMNQAMPIFLGICVVAALLDCFGIITVLARTFAPALAFVGLPGEVAPAVLFGILRKDGLLVLNQGDGALASKLGPAVLFVTVYFASTVAACLVTLWTVGREMGARAVWGIAVRQMITAIVSTAAISLAIRLIGPYLC